MELKRYTYKTCYDVKMVVYNIQKYKNRHQKLNSYMVMNSHRDNPVLAAE